MNVKTLHSRLRRDWWIVLAALLVGLVAAAAYLGGARPQYQASTQVFVSASGAQVSDLSLGVSFTQQIVKSFADLASSDYVVDRALKQVDAAPGVPRSDDYSVSASAPVDQTTITITATADDPVFAARLADEVSVALQASVPTVMGAQEDSVTMTLIRLAAVPTTRSGPPSVLILAIALAASLAVAALVLALRSRFSVRVTSADDLRQDPRLDGVAVTELAGALGTEAAGLLDQRVVAIVGDEPGAQVDRFTTALAAFSTRAGSDVLVVDMRTDATGGEGFWSVARGRTALAEAIREDPRGFVLLPPGTADVAGFRALRGDALPRILEDALSQCDQVLLVVGGGQEVVAHATPAIREASHVVVVGALGRSRRAAVAQTVEWARSLKGTRPDVVLVREDRAWPRRDRAVRLARTEAGRWVRAAQRALAGRPA